MNSKKTKDNNRPTDSLANDEHKKIAFTLIEHVYSQINIALISSLFCASMVFVGLYDPVKNNNNLFIWSIFFLVVTFFRLINAFLYKKNANLARIKLWSDLYVFGSFLGGISWGLAGILFFPSASSIQQTFLILMLAGVSSGSVPLSAAIPKAGISFLVASVLPFIIIILSVKNYTYYLFDTTLTLYLIYTIVLTFKIYTLIKQSIILKYENDDLLINLKISNKMLENSATHDPLTNISNRRLFRINLDEAISRAKLKNSMVSLFYLDLDHFKQANDTYGHEAGDFILKNVIYKLKTFFRKDDLLARIGGDEFAIIIEDAKNWQELKIIAKKICELIALPVKMNNLSLQVAVSIGISTYPDDGSTMDELVNCADKRMFFAKKHGGNQFSFKVDK